MKRIPSFLPARSSILVEALEPRIAPAGLLNESKFTSVVVGGTVLLDASGGPNDFQGLSTGFGANSGTYLLYLVQGKALVYTSDLNGDGQFEPGEITGISLGVDSLGRAPELILFSDVHGDIVTNLLPGHGVSALSDSDNNPNNGRDGRVLLDTSIAGITIRTVTSADLDSSIPGDTVANRLGLTSFSIYGNIYSGGSFGGLTIDTSGISALATKFSGSTGVQLFTGATPQVGSIETGTAVNGQAFHFTEQATNNVEGTMLAFTPAPGEHGGDISNVMAASPATTFSIGELATGAGGTGARGGNISNVVLNGDTGSYELIAGDGGSGPIGGQGGSILNFNDLGTITGQVILHTGAGGTGTLSAGGAGGTATFATTNVAAGVEVFLGNGGDGFSSGGAGAGLAAGVFTSPEGVMPLGSKFLGTWHDIGDVGNTHPNADGTYSPEVINFNDPSFFTDPVLKNNPEIADHFGDAVFSANTPGEVVVVFGTGPTSANGFLADGIRDNDGNFNVPGAETVVLHVPGIVDPVFTVGDFNGDGRPDIAVASADPNNFAGVYVFLDQIGTTQDPINAHNFSGNPLGDHPFSGALQSAIPSISNLFSVFTGPGAVLALTAGDFNGDGLTDLALVQEVTDITTGGVGVKQEVVGVLFGTAAVDASGHPMAAVVNGQTRNEGTGFLYANAASPTDPTTLQFELPPTVSDAHNPILKATSLTSTNLGPDGTLGAPEIIGYGVPGQDHLYEVSVAGVSSTHQPFGFGLDFTPVALGKVDTDRLTGPTHIALTGALLEDFTFSDIDNSKTADLAVLTQTPLEFLVTFNGNGVVPKDVDGVTFTIASGNGDNAGLFLSPDATTPPQATVLVAVDPDGIGQFNGFAFLSFPTIGPVPVINEVTLAGGNLAGAPTFDRSFEITSGLFVADQTIAGLDAFYVQAPHFDTNPALETNLHPSTGYGLISPNSTNINFADVYIFGSNDNVLPTDARPTVENGYFITGGNGGNATAGTGGDGGSIGTPTLSAAGATSGVAGAVQIVFPADLQYAGQDVLIAGNGGNGFAGGGNGGALEGLSARYATGTTVLHSSVFSSAGNGGNSIAGPGGNGGNIDTVSVETGVYFSSGNGGNGATGGTGGNIIGNGSVYDTTDGNTRTGGGLTVAQAARIGLITDTTVDFAGVGLSTGTGGQGNTTGGQGGSITGWDAVFTNRIGSTGGSLYYATGAGGSAAAGTGGSGGSITNSSPDTSQNNLSGDLHLETGAGGSGLTGGDGGALTTFVNQPTQPTAVAGLLSVTTGSGGVGISGNGGSGGTITSFQSNATGLEVNSLFGLFGVGRVIAGDGGASYGGQAGNGGGIINVTAQTTSTPIVVAAGAGGVGLTIGGTGGTVSNSVINSAAQQIGKVLIVAGAGGDAISAMPAEIALPGDANTGDLAHALLAFGGVSAQGGDGGDISKVSQPISTQTAVDLIAGNGGNTINSGTSLDATTGVGRGGSVVDVTLAGTVGAVSRNSTLGTSANPPIQAYAATDPFGATSTLPITAIIDLVALPDNPIFSLNDTASYTGFANISGNVGIVAGAAGRVRNGQPARDGLNGSAQNISAESIMSIVAGSVSSVAPVNVLGNITVTDPDGVFGVDRSIDYPYTANGQLDYFSSNLNGTDLTNTPLQAGDSLVLQQQNADGTITPVAGGDGALFAITIQPAAGTILQGPRIFTVLGNT